MRAAKLSIALALATTISLAIAGCGGDGSVEADGGLDAFVELDGRVALDAREDVDAPGAIDAATDDAQAVDAGPDDDAGAQDGGPLCEGMIRGACTGAGLSCECCPAGGPLERCLCTTPCTSDAECTDPARPHCNQESTGSAGLCTPAAGFVCAWGAVCAAPDTPISTPTGARPIASLLPGDLVYSLDHGALRAVPIREVGRQIVSGHRVVRATLESGAVLEISEGHPTADGRFFRDLVPGERLDGVMILSVELVPYPHDATYDILPDGETGTYVAAGVLVGSTLAH
jgi:hypothetical protein